MMFPFKRSPSDNVVLIAGLGNPGAKYANSRHNIGFKTIDFLSQKYGIKVNKPKGLALTGTGRIAGRRVVLAKPQTFMNASGESLRELCGAFRAKPADAMIVIYDDIDLEAGRIRVRRKGSAGTHNGMRSVIGELGTDEFARVRIGIGRPTPERRDLAGFVLEEFRDDELQTMFEAVERAAGAVADILADGVDAAMGRHNS